MYEGLWSIKAQLSTQITTWRVLENKIESKVNLERRGISFAGNTCSMCGEEEETMSHLFCTCIIGWLVWSKCYEWVSLISINHWESKRHFSLLR